jgi:peptide/nickel transport system permease protein
VLAFNLFGDSMRTILDPRRRNAHAANVPGASL